ncbi:hypothetical protein DH2020_007604 [Rehmannia glutinosa]|uniref:Uncharacterized protein n=1 Tax=Rehmannia glutinosa TaxID=99300 RepID=A0ABR0TZJ0_REHGL
MRRLQLPPQLPPERAPRRVRRRDGDGPPLHLPPPLPSPSMSQHRAGGATHWSPMVQPMKMAFNSGGGSGSAGTDSSSEELNFNAFHSNAGVAPPPQFVTKKRYRTKFTTEQKEKMLEFAEKLGWRIPREDDTDVQRFCAEVGVKRQRFVTENLPKDLQLKSDIFS